MFQPSSFDTTSKDNIPKKNYFANIGRSKDLNEYISCVSGIWTSLTMLVWFWAQA